MRTEINWENWNRIVEQTKRDIAEALKDFKAPTQQIARLYNEDGELVKTFNTQRECAEYLKGVKSTVSNYLKKQWNYNGYLLSLEELRKDVAFAMFKFNKEHGKAYFEGCTKKQIPVYIYSREGRLVGAYSSQYKWSKANKKGNTLISKSDRVFDDRLVSINRYKVEEAKKQYQAILNKNAKNTIS